MTPNIKRTGRIIRALGGFVCLLGSVAAWWGHWPASAPWRWLVPAALVIAGVFQIFEARQRWCVLRACGLKTPL